MKQLRLEVLFGGKNKLSPALKAIMGSSNAASRALKKTRDEIRSLNEQQKKIDGYQKQKKAVQDQAKALQDLQNHIKNLRQQMKTNPSADLTRDFDKSVAKARKLKQEYEKNRIELQRMRTEMNNAGLSTSQLSEHQVRLRNQLNQANQSMREQEQRLQRMTQMHRNYERQAGNIRAAAGYGMGTAMAGAGALYSMRKPIEESKKMDISENRIASIGLGKEATKEATDFARSMKTFGTSAVDNMNLVLDGATAFADVHHAKMVAPMLAKMKFANEAMFGQEKGADNEKKFMDMLKVIEMRNGLKSEKTFKDQANIIQQVITATGGRVQPEEWLNATKRGGLAVQGMTNEAFYYKMEPLVQMMGGHGYGNAAMSAYQNIYQGRTTQRASNNLAKFDLIGDPSKVKYNKTGDLAHLDIGAIKGAALFKKDQFAWMEQVLIPAINAKGITKEDDVVDVIGSFFSNRTASSLFARMYAQRENIHKNMKLNAGADNIDQLDARAQNTTSGKELEAKAKLHDAYLKFGTTILPVYTKAIEIATGALQTFTGWMERNPTLAKALGIGLLGIAASLLVIGGALVVFSPLILSMLSLRLILASTTMTGSIFGLMIKGLISPFRLMGSLALKSLPLLKWLGTAFLTVGRYALLATGRLYLFAIRGIGLLATGIIRSAIFGLQLLGQAFLFVGRMALVMGRFLLANPILLVIAAIATGVYLIYKNWDSIGPWFAEQWNKVKNSASSAWESVKSGASSAWISLTTIFAPVGSWFTARWIEIKSAFSGGIGSISALIMNWSPLGLFYTAFAGVLRWFGIDLLSKFTGFGSMIIDGLVNGIKSGFEKLKSIWATVTNYIPSYFKEKQQIRSPSRVMAGLGGHIMGGIGLGLEQGFPSLKEKFQHAVNIFNPRASEAISKIDVTPALNKVRPSPSLSPRQASGSVVIQGDTITIQITQAPGQSLQQLQAMLENMLDRREREKHARIRSSYKDQV